MPSDDTTKQQSNTADDQSGHGDVPPVLTDEGTSGGIPPERRAPESSNNQGGSKPTRAERSFFWLSILFDALLVIVTSVYAYFAYHQWQAMEASVKRQTEAICQTQTLIEQQREALGYAKTQADVAKKALEDARSSTIPVIQMGGWDFKPSGGFNPGKITAFVSLANRGSADVTNATAHIVMEIRKDEPPLNYQPQNWKISSNVTIQRNYGERSFEISRIFSPSEVGEIQSEQKFICVFGFLDYLDPFGNKACKRFCVKYGSTSNGSFARECETWQGQECYPK